jgi:MFS family permease
VTPTLAGPETGDRRDPVLGLRANASQFIILVAVNALVGGMVGQERTLLPLLAVREFQVSAYTGSLTFIVAFGVAKAVTNYFAGIWADRYGRKPVLVVGWLVSLPVPLLIAWAPAWSWIVGANVLLGISQGLTWSTTVIMKIDLAGPARRGLAMGLNEAAGYGAVATTALATGYLAARYGLRPEPFYLGIAYAALGLGLSAAAVRDTSRYVGLAEDADRFRGVGRGGYRTAAGLSNGQVFAQTSAREPALSAACQAGMVNNINDGLAWGLFPVLFASSGLSVTRIGALAALYPAVWGLGQLLTGALSDRIGRKPLIVTGMLTQAVALGVIASGNAFVVWAIAAVMLGAGTALAYPTLLAVVGDVAYPGWRARAVGVYRFWRDAGFAVGALLCGVSADAFDVRAPVWGVAVLTAVSGLVVAARMYETMQPCRSRAA